MLQLPVLGISEQPPGVRLLKMLGEWDMHSRNDWGQGNPFLERQLHSIIQQSHKIRTL